MIKVNLRSSRPSIFKRVVREIRSAAPQIGRAVLMALPAVFGMPLAMTIEMPSTKLHILKSRAQAAIAHNEPIVEDLADREIDIRHRTDSALQELEQQVRRFRRSLEGSQEHAEVMAHITRDYENTYLIAANDLTTYLRSENLPLKEKFLARANAELRIIEMIEEIGPVSAKLRMLNKFNLRSIELQDRERQLTQMDEALEFTKATIDQAFDAERAIRGDISLEEILHIFELKLGWFRTQLSTLDFRRKKVMPLREEVMALETILLNVLGGAPHEA